MLGGEVLLRQGASLRLAPPFIFNEVAEAFQWICAHHLSIEDMLHLLDDFLVLGPPKSVLCEQRITLALQMCHYLGIPIADEKTTWPSTELIFLGIILDTDKFESRLPDDKREDLLRLLEDMIERKHCTLKELEHLLGKLQFASRVVIPGRTFLRRLYDAAGHATQSFHRVRLSTACRLDLRWWKHFLQSWNGRSFFLEPWYTLASDLQVQTDAAASVGFGAICGGEWFTGCWSDLQSRCCITYMELYPIALACSTWGHKWTAKRITDNQAVAACITSGTCRCGNVMSLLRALFFVCAKNNCQITATYFPGSTNTIADALSRQEWDRFRQLAPQARESPTAITSLPCIPGETSLQRGDFSSAVRFYAQQALAPATRKAYTVGQGHFHRFCSAHARAPLPATERTLAEFIAYLADVVRCAPATIKLYLAAVRNMHVERGLGDPFMNTTLPDHVFRGVKRTLGTHARLQRLPVTLPVLRTIIGQLRTRGNREDTLTLAVACSLAFFAFMRSGELLALR